MARFFCLLLLAGVLGSLGAGAPSPAPAAAQAIQLTVNVDLDRRPISPYIYGMNFPDPDELGDPSASLVAELNLPLVRWGGNATTRYNWQVDATNHASDWYFENLPEANPAPEDLPAGSSADRFIALQRANSAQVALTVPLIGWTAKSRALACGFSIAKYGSQSGSDPWAPDCGSGWRANGDPVTGNDPTDTSLAITPDFVTAWIAHLQSEFGSAADGGVRFYNLDNEPMLWNSTHRDVHPAPTSYDELRDRTLTYAAAIKAADPQAATLGPVLWGWSAYFWSALDSAPGGDWWNHPQDRLAHGDQPFVPWYLAQLRAYEQTHGQRLLDYLDLHYYPQAEGVTLAAAGSSEVQARRLRSTRDLWDASYTAESWIGEPVRLIPRMREWVDTYYPGTRLALTEYNWGGLEHINGALAQAEVLGIFGREGLDLAALWAPPTRSQPGAFAFRMYRNYDGAKSTFGETHVQAISSAPQELSLFAAQRVRDGAVTVMVINPTGAELTANLNLGGATSRVAEVYRYSPANLAAIERQPDLPAGLTSFASAFPAQSLTLFVFLPETTSWQRLFLPVVR